MKILLNILLLISIIPPTLAQQQGAFNYKLLLQQLENDIPNGNKRALRDLGSLLDKKETDQTARAILAKATFFTPEEIDIKTASKQDFLGFYYDNEQKLLYSELLHGFYTTPLENRKVDFKMQASASEENDYSGVVRRYFKDIDDLIADQHYEEIHPILSKIKETGAGDEQLLFHMLQDQRLFEAPDAIRQKIYQNILNQLSDFPEIEIAETTIQMWEGGFLEEDFAIPYLARLLNCTSPYQENSFNYFQSLLDSLGNLNEVRRHGYEMLFDFKLNFFQFPVDYYGKILGQSGPFSWISKNALLDLKQTHHPRALFYVAAHLYHIRHSSDAKSYNDLIRFLQSMTNVEIGVADQNGQTTFSPDRKDETACLNFLIYWASNYPDYEWDENRKVFTNKLESLVKTQNYEKLFRRLNSRNDSVAVNSFLQLTQGDPVEINALAKKYRQLLRNHNNSLPSLKFGYLEQLTLLTHFCKKNNFQYQANKKLQKLLDKLVEPQEFSERYVVENQLIEILTIDNITVLEYWACLHEGNQALTFSAGRILDWFYSKNWEKLLKDNDQLRFYLKKSYLFENIGVSGVCNAYLNKFDPLDKYQQERLSELEKIESDEDIINQITLLLAAPPDQGMASNNLDAFVQNPEDFKRRDIKILASPNPTELLQMVDVIIQTESTENIKKYFTFLRLHPKIEFVPHFFKLIDDKRVIVKRSDLEITVADHIVPILENVYAYNFPRIPEDPYSTKQWKSLWESDSLNYTNWAQTFYAEKLDSLKFKSELTIEELNQLAESPNFSEAQKSLILEQLKKVKPIKNIRRLDIQHLLSVEQDLIYFENFFLSYKELDDLPKLFDVNAENAALMLTYLQEKSAAFNFSEKGSFYNNLFQFPWLNQYLSSENVNPEITANIKSALEEYLNKSDFLSEFEEQASIMNIAQINNIGVPLEQKLLSTLQLDVDIATKNKVIDEIIATVAYKDIGRILNNFNPINNIISDGFSAFLHRDFGLPIFKIKNQTYLEELIRNHAQMTENEFYLHYLKAFGIDFLDKHGELDYQKISDILQFDIISPFVGEGGGKRDDYSYGIIKLLELKFNTRLGFHEKLNEGQTFYSFSSSKRAQAWINYLLEHKLIDPALASPPSFNQLKKEL